MSSKRSRPYGEDVVVVEEKEEGENKQKKRDHDISLIMTVDEIESEEDCNDDTNGDRDNLYDENQVDDEEDIVIEPEISFIKEVTPDIVLISDDEELPPKKRPRRRVNRRWTTTNSQRKVKRAAKKSEDDGSRKLVGRPPKTPRGRPPKKPENRGKYDRKMKKVVDRARSTVNDEEPAVDYSMFNVENWPHAFPDEDIPSSAELPVIEFEPFAGDGIARDVSSIAELPVVEFEPFADDDDAGKVNLELDDDYLDSNVGSRVKRVLLQSNYM